MLSHALPVTELSLSLESEYFAAEPLAVAEMNQRSSAWAEVISKTVVINVRNRLVFIFLNTI